MSYHLRTRRASKASRPLIFFILVLFILGTLLFSPLSWAMRNLVHSIGTDTLVKNILNWAVSKKTLISEREKMEQRLAELEVQSIERDLLFEENQELKGLDMRKGSVILATVLLHPGFSPYDTLVLSRGSSAGVELGDMVVFQSLAIGEISEVETGSSRASLFSSSGKTFPVRIGKNKIEAEAKGLGGGSFEVLLPKNIEIEIGDAVVLASNHPRIFGTVLDKDMDDDAFQRILFALPININSIQFVEIEKRDSPF